MGAYGLKSLQEKILEIVLYIDDLCRKNNIEYYLTGGCVLGAIRHGGFIPWDDDLDVFMTSENYYKFLRVCEEQLDKDRFYLQKENTEEWPLFFSKIRMNGTTYQEAYNKDLRMHKGIFVDVCCLDNISDNKILAYYQFICSRLLIAKVLPKINYSTNSFKRKMLLKILSIFPDNLLIPFLLSQVKMFNNKKCKNVGYMFHRGTFKQNTFPVAWLGKMKYVPFEHTELPVPENVYKYLKTRFGENYMAIPPMLERKISPHVISYDIENQCK